MGADPCIVLVQSLQLSKHFPYFRRVSRNLEYYCSEVYHTESMLESAFRHATAAGLFWWSMTRSSIWTSPSPPTLWPLWPSVLENVSVLNVVNKLGLLVVIFRRGLLFPQDEDFLLSTMLWYVISNDVVAIKKIQNEMLISG